MGRPAIGASAKNSSQSASSLTTAAITTQKAGSGFVFGVMLDVVLASFVSLTDNKGNASQMVQIGAEQQIGNDTSRFYYLPNGVGGDGHTFTLTISAATLCTLLVAEIVTQNRRGVRLVDHVAGPNDLTSPYDTGALTLRGMDQLLVAFYADDSFSGTATHTVSGFTLLQEETNADTLWSGCLAAKVAAVPGSYSASMTQTASLGGSTPYLAAFVEEGVRVAVPKVPWLDDEGGQFESDVIGRNWY